MALRAFLPPPVRLCRLYTEPSGATRSTIRLLIRLCRMCTSMVLVEDALPVQPVMSMVDSTVDRSGMATSVPLVTGAQPGGGGVPAPTNSRRFGEPVPGLTMWLRVASLNIWDATCAGVRVGLAPRMSAAAPVTCGVAIDVPLMVLVAVSLVFHAEVMFTPGAKMSVQVPKLEKEARLSLMSLALTVMASATRAGVKLQASALELPDAMA